QHQLDARTGELAAAQPQAQGPLVARRDALQHQVADLQSQLTKVTEVPGPQLAAAARPPASASEPHPVRDTLLGLVAGLVLGIVAALVAEYVTQHAARRQHEAVAEPEPTPAFVPVPEPEPAPEPVPEAAPVLQEEELQPEEEAEPEEAEPAVERSGPGVPVLGMIPAVAAWRGRERPLLRRDQPASPAAEAYRGLAATLQHILPHRPLRSLIVTSPARGAGRTTVAANL